MRNEIRAKLYELDMQLPDLAKKINRSAGYLSRALNNKAVLRVDEAFKIGDILGLSDEKIREFFAWEEEERGK